MPHLCHYALLRKADHEMKAIKEAIRARKVTDTDTRETVIRMKKLRYKKDYKVSHYGCVIRDDHIGIDKMYKLIGRKY